MNKSLPVSKNHFFISLILMLVLASCTAPEIPDATIGHYSVAFSLPNPGIAKLVIANRFDTVVKTLGPEYFEAGTHTFDWNRLDNNDELVPIGLYFATLLVDGEHIGTATLNLLHSTGN